MDGNKRKLDAAFALTSATGSDPSIKFMKFMAKPLTTALPKPTRTGNNNNNTGGGISRTSVSKQDEAINDIQVIVANNQAHILQLEQNMEHWKEHIATQSESTASSQGTRLQAAEATITALSRQINQISEETKSSENKAKDKWQSRIEEAKVECQTEMRGHMQDFASHIAAFFTENPISINPQTAFQSYGSAAEMNEPTTEDNDDGSEPSGSPIKTPSLAMMTEFEAPTDAVGAPPGTITAACNLFSALGRSLTGYFGEPQLTASGYQALLHNFDFNDALQLENLSKIDNRRGARDYILFCDTAPPSFNIDYVVRIGGSSVSIMDNILPPICDGFPTLQDADLQELRLLELVLSEKHLSDDDLAKFKEWKGRYAPPRFVYELGQLFLFRQCKKAPKNEAHSSSYNVVMDVTRPEKSVWLVVRPGCPLDPRKRNNRKHKDSTMAFYGLDGGMIACMAKSINDLDLTWGRTARTSFPQFQAALGLVKETCCNLSIDVLTKAVNMVEMKEAMMSNSAVEKTELETTL